MRERRAADLPGAVLRRPLAGPRRLPAPHRSRPVSATTPTRCSTPSSRGRSSRRSCISSASTTACSPRSRASTPASRTSCSGDGSMDADRPARATPRCTATSSRGLERWSARRRSRPTPSRSPTAPSARSPASAAQRLIADDHLSLVAGARRDQRERLVELGMPTVPRSRTRRRTSTPAARRRALRAAAPPGRPAGPLARHRRPLHRHLAPSARRGLRAACRAPSPGDVFFDLEGDPYVGDGGIEYLWGWWTRRRGYECVWAHDADAEKAALRALRRPRRRAARANIPGMHVFHYAPHELSKLRSLSVAVRHARGRGRRPPARRGPGRPLRRRAPGRCRSARRATRSRSSSATTASRASRSACAKAAARSSPTRPGSRPATTELLEAIRAYNEEDCTLDAVAARLAARTRCGPRPRPSSASTSTISASPSPRRSTARRRGCPTRSR